MGNFISGCCKSKAKSVDLVDKKRTGKKDEPLFKRNAFIVHKTEKFKDNYLIGQSMGCGTFGEVRKCKHSKY